MPSDGALFEYLLRLGDGALILSHRLSEWCGHAPVLEEDLGLANVALDLLGQARLWLSYAADVEGRGNNEDRLAYERDAGAYRNPLLVEKPNGHFGDTIARQFYFDAWHYPLLGRLRRSSDGRIAAIAEKAQKEAAYHLRRSADWVVRLGDGTEESHQRIQRSIDDLWPYTGELFAMDTIDAQMRSREIGCDLAEIHPAWNQFVSDTLQRATLTRPSGHWMQSGGKQGFHSEKLGYILAEMQFLQRAYPGASW